MNRGCEAVHWVAVYPTPFGEPFRVALCDREFVDAESALQYARRVARAGGTKVNISCGEELVATVWPRGQVDMTFFGSCYL